MANGLPMRLSPFFGNQASPFPPQAPQSAPQQQGFNPTALLGLQQGLQGFLQAGQRGGLGEALLGLGTGALGGVVQGRVLQQQRQDKQAAVQAAAQQQKLENRRAKRAADLAQAKFRQGQKEFGITSDLGERTEQRLLTNDQREAQDLAFRQDNAVQQLQLNQAKFRLDQATSAPDKIQVLQAMGLDPASPEGRELLTASLTKPQVQINRPKLSPGQIPIDPNDLSKGSIDAKEIGQARIIANGIGTNIRRYADTLRKFGAETFAGKGRDKLKSQRTQLLFDLKTLNELGALQGPDLELMADLLIDPTSTTTRVGNAFSSIFGSSLGERALANLDILEQQVGDRLNAITGLVGQPAGIQAPAEPAATPADATDAQLLQSLGLQ